MTLNSNQAAFAALQQRIAQAIIGQDHLIQRLLIALLADGHLLVEGAPGLAKTRAIKVLSEAIEADFHRVQFTPDLLPADLVGTDIFRPQDGSFHFQPGPLFHHIILADEVNRAPAKVQSALLEAMAERQITVGGTTYPLPSLFMVMATQNPLEQEGTYPLPEAQLDRFLLHVRVDYPDSEAERRILHLARQEALAAERPTMVDAPRLKQSTLFAARREILSLHLAPPLEAYLVEIIMATRQPARYLPELARWIAWGASPRATIALDRTARAHAWLAGRDYVSPADIQAVAADVLRHRLLLTYTAQAEGIDADRCIASLLNEIAVP
jgi:MoxR-like ATPase